MKIDLKKLDEQIAKLQEIRRIAGDQELTAMLLQFVSNEESDSAAPVVVAPKIEAAPVPRVDDLIKEVVNGTSSETKDGGGLWSRRR